MARLPESGSADAKIRELERRVQQLERADRLGNTSFQEPGKVRFRDATGDIRFVWGAQAPGDLSLFYFDGEATSGQAAAILGVVYEEGTDTIIGHGILVQDPTSGVDLLQAWRGGTGGWNFQLRDPSGTRLVHIDENGMAYPRLPQMFVPGYAGSDAVLADGIKTVSEGYVRGTYTEGTIEIRYIVSGTVTARYRVIDNASGTELVGWQTFTTSGYGNHVFPLDRSLWATADLRRLVRVQCEVTSGSGTATIYTVACYVGDF